MESIQELRKLLQEEKVHPQGWRRPWGYKTFQRGPSIYITRALLPYHVKPNQVTIAGLVCGLAGCYLLIQFEWYMKLAGLFFLYVGILADKVDGEIARYKKIYSLEGIFWDEIAHLLIPPLFWLSLTFGISKISIFEMRYLFAAGFLGVLALVTNRVVHSLAPQIYAKKYLKNPAFFEFKKINKKETTDILPARKIPPWLVKSAKALHQFQDFFVLITTTAVVVGAETIFREDSLFHPYLSFFVLIMSILLVVFAIENILRKVHTLEEEVELLSLKTKTP